MVAEDLHDYDQGEVVIEVFGALTEPQWNRLLVMLGRPAQRYKSYATHTAFTLDNEIEHAARWDILDYLREQALRHSLTVEHTWAAKAVVRR